MWLRLASALLLAAQVPIAASFGPKDLLSTPRNSAPSPNPAGTLGLYSSSSYSFDEHKKTSSWNVLDLKDGASLKLFPSTNVTSAHWLSDKAVLYTNASDETGETFFWVAPSYDSDKVYRAATIAGPISDLKLVVQNNDVHFVFSALSYPDGKLYNPKTAPKIYTTGRVYESLYVRHWDTYIRPEKSSLFSGVLSLNDGVYALSSGLKNLLPSGSGLETPIPTFGGADDFDISPDGKLVTFVSKTPTLNPANNTQTLVYLVPFDGSTKPDALNNPAGQGKDTKGIPVPLAQGASSSPTFSPDGKLVAHLQMYKNGYESDRNLIFIVDIESRAVTLLNPTLDISPQKIVWSRDGKYIYSTADRIGRHILYKVSVKDSEATIVTKRHTVGSIKTLSEDKLLVHIDSLVSSPRTHILEEKDSAYQLTPLQSQPENEKLLLHSSVEDLWFAGADDVKVHGFIVKPSFFDKREKHKMRMAFFIHGGPQGAWNDGWSTRWNPVVFAEQGYIVVAVNPTGSTGYGQKFTDAIRGQWGGKPYKDLEKAIEYLENTPEYDYIDFDNMVALGASYGGYMINWIQGNSLGRKFKALVCHDGGFSTLNQYSTEELYFPQHDFEGTIWENRAAYEQWDPAKLLVNWATPQMIIHSELDYRLPVSEGLAPFNVLQERGVPSKFLHFPDENHWVLNPENSLLWHTEVLEWIDRFTTGESKETAKAPLREL